MSWIPTVSQIRVSYRLRYTGQGEHEGKVREMPDGALTYIGFEELPSWLQRLLRRTILRVSREAMKDSS